MSFIDKLKTRVQEISVSASEKIKLAEPEVTAKRIEICNACPELMQATRVCTKCGCFTVAKTKLKNVECPLKKW